MNQTLKEITEHRRNCGKQLKYNNDYRSLTTHIKCECGHIWAINRCEEDYKHVGDVINVINGLYFGVDNVRVKSDKVEEMMSPTIAQLEL